MFTLYGCPVFAVIRDEKHIPAALNPAALNWIGRSRKTRTANLASTWERDWRRLLGSAALVIVRADLFRHVERLSARRILRARWRLRPSNAK